MMATMLKIRPRPKLPLGQYNEASSYFAMPAFNKLKKNRHLCMDHNSVVFVKPETNDDQ